MYTYMLYLQLCLKCYFPGFGEKNTQKHRASLLALLIVYKLLQLS